MKDSMVDLLALWLVIQLAVIGWQAAVQYNEIVAGERPCSSEYVEEIPPLVSALFPLSWFMPERECPKVND